MLTEKLQDLRLSYIKHSLDESSVNANPLLQFTLWFNEAIESELREPNAMTLSTSTRDGKPSSRIVLLKGADESGFVFYTNYQSAKGRQLDENPFTALLFFWSELERQVRIEGRVERVSQEESYQYFSTRPVGSRLGAWASKQSSVVAGRTQLEEQFRETEHRFGDGEIPLPEFWGGYRVIPESYEFWQGRENRLHDRIRYSKYNGTSWNIERLSP
jgi:pyridoxamine 5'-phosphate oxidase